MPRRNRANIKRNPIQVLQSCVPGCFRLAQKRFVRIEDVEHTHKRKEPIVLESAQAIRGFEIGKISWRFIWNHIRSIGGTTHGNPKRLLPVVPENRFWGRINPKDSMDWCPVHWDYFTKGSHEEHASYTMDIKYMQSPARVDVQLLPEFSGASTLYQICENDPDIVFPGKSRIMKAFERNEADFDSLITAILDVGEDDTEFAFSEWSHQYEHNEWTRLKTLKDNLGDAFPKLIRWVLSELKGEAFKDLSHSRRIASLEGKRIYKSPTVLVNYSTDTNIIRYVFDVERCPLVTPEPADGKPKKRRFQEMFLPFRSRGIDCIAGSSRVESLVLCFSEEIDHRTAHTYIHALTKFLSEKFDISEDVFRHHIDEHFSLLFVDQPINLGLMEGIDENDFGAFHRKRCDGSKHCVDMGACPGACHHCLHFPFYTCSEPEDMTDLDWKLLGNHAW